MLADGYPIFQSTLPAWGETFPILPRRFVAVISIHSPRMGRDRLVRKQMLDCLHFNPLSPHGERHLSNYTACVHVYFNPLSPHGERLFEDINSEILLDISIHSPRMGRDLDGVEALRRLTEYFNPLSPHGERLGACEYAIWNGYFNPLSPHGERRNRVCRVSFVRTISIHSPRMGRDIMGGRGAIQSIAISIHSPRMGRDLKISTYLRKWWNFNPLSPHGERLSS